METLQSFDPVQVLDDVYLLPSYCPVPGMGVLPINAFLVRGAEPTLIDSGAGPLAADFVESLSTIVDLEDLRWLWLTHTDPDHVGAVERVLEAAPKARVVITFLGAAKMSFHRPLPEDRIHLINPGERLSVGDRELVALRPPVYDAPETVGAFDTASRALFTADCFGTLMSEPPESAQDVDDAALGEGLIAWAQIDTPWLEYVSRDRLQAAAAKLQRLEPAAVLSGHRPPSRGGIDRLCGQLLAAVDAVRPVDLDEKISEAVDAVF